MATQTLQNSLGIPWEVRAVSKAAVFQSLRYIPTSPQLSIHFNPARERALTGGERSGKSFTGAKEVVGEAMLGDLYWVVGPDYEQARPEFGYIVDDLRRLGAIAKTAGGVEELSFPREGPLAVTTVWGAQIVTKSAKEPERLGAWPPNGILICEAAKIPFESFIRLRARTAEKRGWLLLTGTLEQAHRWYPSIVGLWEMPDNADGAFAVVMPTASNIHIFPGGEVDPELLRQRRVLGEEVFQERFEGKPVPQRGLVLPEMVRDLGKYFQDGVECLPELPVYLAIDPGWDNPYSILAIQETGNQIRVFDEIYLTLKTTREIQKRLMERPWFDAGRIGYGAIDVSAKAHKDADRTTLMQWISPFKDETMEWPGLDMVSNYVHVEAGIARMKSLLSYLLVSSKCGGFVNEVHRYRRPKEREGGRWDVKPIDSNNHSIKALIYWMVAKYGLVQAPTQSSWQPFSVG